MEPPQNAIDSVLLLLGAMLELLGVRLLLEDGLTHRSAPTHSLLLDDCFAISVLELLGVVLLEDG